MPETQTATSPTDKDLNMRFQRAMDEGRSLKTTETIISSIEKSLLNRTPDEYDKNTVYKCASEYKEAMQDKNVEKMRITEKVLKQELSGWRYALAYRDEVIMTYHLRRFCERTSETLDLQAYLSLARFYYQLEHDANTQSKFDFVITRAFSQTDETQRRMLITGKERLTDKATELFAFWSEENCLPVSKAFDEKSALLKFKSFIEEIESLKQIDQISSSDLFNRIRAFKKELGEEFYRPAVTVAAIECNVSAYNKFSELLEAEGNKVTDAPPIYRELVQHFSDVSADSPEDLSTLFENEQIEEAKKDNETVEQLQRLFSLLRMSGAVDGIDSVSSTGKTNDKRLISLPVTLQEAAKHPENLALIEEYYSLSYKSSDFSAIKPQFFLNSVKEEPELYKTNLDEEMRRAFHLIIRNEKILREKVTEDTEIDSQTEKELTELWGEMQMLGEHFRRQMEKAWEYDHNQNATTFIHISNHLLGAKLRFQSFLVQCSAAKIEEQKSLQKQFRSTSKAKRPLLQKQKDIVILPVVTEKNHRHVFATRWLQSY